MLPAKHVGLRAKMGKAVLHNVGRWLGAEIDGRISMSYWFFQLPVSYNPIYESILNKELYVICITS